jgi:hypothetical protein
MTTITNQISDEEEFWGFYVDIENIVINNNDIQKKNKFHLNIEDISEEYEYYLKEQSIIENTLYKNEENKKKVCICIHICNIIYTTITTVLLVYFIFCVI